jgi:hypothetical protein
MQSSILQNRNASSSFFFVSLCRFIFTQSLGKIFKVVWQSRVHDFSTRILLHAFVYLHINTSWVHLHPALQVDTEIYTTNIQHCHDVSVQLIVEVLHL